MIRRFIAVAALMLLAAVAFAPASPAEAGSPPYPGNPHWKRGFGTEAITRYAAAPSAYAIHPFMVDAANSWNQRSPYNHLVVLSVGQTCEGLSNCITVAEDNGRTCGHAQAYVNYILDAGLNHFKEGLIAGNFQGCNLTMLYVKFMFCHEYGHTQGLAHVDNLPTGQEPCYGWTGMPTDENYDVRNFLHAHWD